MRLAQEELVEVSNAGYCDALQGFANADESIGEAKDRVDLPFPGCLLPEELFKLLGLPPCLVQKVLFRSLAVQQQVVSIGRNPSPVALGLDEKDPTRPHDDMVDIESVEVEIMEIIIPFRQILQTTSHPFFGQSPPVGILGPLDHVTGFLLQVPPEETLMPHA
jgi:hypothetical protein